MGFGRYACGLEEANSTKLDPRTKDPVVEFMPEQKTAHDAGGSMLAGQSRNNHSFKYKCRKDL